MLLPPALVEMVSITLDIPADTPLLCPRRLHRSVFGLPVLHPGSKRARAWMAFMLAVDLVYTAFGGWSSKPHSAAKVWAGGDGVQWARGGTQLETESLSESVWASQL